MQDRSSILVEQPSDGRATMTLAGEMSPLNAAELHRVSVQLLGQAQDVVVQCEQLQSLDLACLQILVALKDSLASQHKSLELANLPAGVIDTISLAGLRESFGLNHESVPASNLTIP